MDETVQSKWSKFETKYDLTEILIKNKVEKVAIWGAGKLGVQLYETIKRKNRVSVCYFIDRTIHCELPDDITCVLPECLLEQERVDAVLITFFDEKTNWDWELIKKTKLRLISINDLLIEPEDEVAFFCKVIGKVKKHGAELVICNFNMPIVHENMTMHEKYVYSSHINWTYYYDKPQLLKEFYDDIPYYTDEYAMELIKHPQYYSIGKKNNALYINDIQINTFNAMNGSRVTTDVPEMYDNSIYIFGSCMGVGTFADDAHTVASYLQRKLQRNPLNNKVYRVKNYSNNRWRTLALEGLLNIEYKEGDIVIVLAKEMEVFSLYFDNLQFFSLDSVFDRPHKYGDKEIFFDWIHMNHRGYDLISDAVYNIMKDLKYGEQITEKVKIWKKRGAVTRDKEASSELSQYLKYLKEKKADLEGEIGSVVVNCNPFTLGHRYLIEKASKLCDYLYVFVVEENRSVFSFEDRIRLVKEGVADLENVKVLRSGQYIISSITFPEYFMKGGDDIKIDVSFDLEMFTDYVAPALNITRRFVGKEPMCHVTRQYNQQMKEILPRKGIEVYEFERIDIGGEPISASRVRKLFDDKEYDEVAKLVPKTTMKYLLESCKCE